jgi:hypothetical protein
MSATLRAALEAVSPADDTVVFLGGTWNGSLWRELFIPQLTVPYFNPIKAVWTEADRERENEVKAVAPVAVYVITPRQMGFYSFIEMMDAVFQASSRKQQVGILFLTQDNEAWWNDEQIASINASITLIKTYPSANVFNSLEELADWVNQVMS